MSDQPTNWFDEVARVSVREAERRRYELLDVDDALMERRLFQDPESKRQQAEHDRELEKR